MHCYDLWSLPRLSLPLFYQCPEMFPVILTSFELVINTDIGFPFILLAIIAKHWSYTYSCHTYAIITHSSLRPFPKRKCTISMRISLHRRPDDSFLMPSSHSITVFHTAQLQKNKVAFYQTILTIWSQLKSHFYWVS